MQRGLGVKAANWFRLEGFESESLDLLRYKVGNLSATQQV